jgi:hypothetical protein
MSVKCMIREQESKMSAGDSAKSAGSLTLTGPAVERDKRVFERNNADRPNIATWLKNAEAQKDAIDAAEVEFFKELRTRAK